ncbi:MAG: protein-export chaperone SecB [Alphaproteobacteria bacterium]|nr:protein-export chaperone SecB [Alphaproteobacteria bacterium]
MSDENQAQGGGGRGAPIMVGAQFVKDLSFESPDGPLGLAEMKDAPEIELDIDVSPIKVADGILEVDLAIKAQARYEDRTLFLCELVYAGIFHVGQMPEEIVKPFCYTEAPRLLFPFARQIIANCTRDGGFPPVLLQPIDFNEFYRRRILGQGNPPGGNGKTVQA